jgi:hypothetical protein
MDKQQFKTLESKGLQRDLDDFVAVASKSKVAVIVPLFGYWSDAKTDQLNQQTLSVFLNRIYSGNHDVYIYIIGNTGRIDAKAAKVIVAKAEAGNYRGIEIDADASYGDYVRKGIDVALTESKSSYFVIANPWLLIQHGAIDRIIDRVNVADDAMIVCGNDVSMTIQPEGFDNFRTQYPREVRGVTFDFACLTRQAAEMFQLDPIYKTHSFLERDTWQTAFIKGFEAVTTEKVPIFNFDVDWKELETRSDFEADKAQFIKKWGFDPGIHYGEKA